MILSQDGPEIRRTISTSEDIDAAEKLSADQQQAYAAAGETALNQCLGRLDAEDREAFWFAVCRCYNRPYNPPEALPVAAIPAAHVIGAAHPCS
ncbi:hypothetical protein [Methylobacterium crusticola]|uniref:hypothetical protein n=1 Tax=Methylobacterium crusticola TaxID=1697972 RepID=UPI001EE1B64E|nr:hypothetical protein [Methylobacterium crusticola]